MWIITPRGFLSIVEKPWDRAQGTLTIRARVKADLLALLMRAGLRHPIIESEDSDYRFRVQVTRVDAQRLIDQALADVNYENFKNEVRDRQGEARASLYARCWSLLLALQPRRQPVRAEGLFDGPAFEGDPGPGGTRGGRRRGAWLPKGRKARRARA